MLFALELSGENRILSINLKMPDTPEPYVIVDNVPEGECTDYLYVDGKYIYDPIAPEPTADELLDIILGVGE